MSDKTLTLNLSSKAKQALFVLANNGKYTPDQLLQASNLCNILSKGSKEEEVETPQGKVKIKKDFTSDVAEITPEEFSLAKEKVSEYKTWTVGDADIYQEFKKELDI